MNLTKKLFSYIVAIAMIFTLTAFAGGAVNAADAKTYTLTLTGTTTGHTYDVYQIFTGDLSTNTDGKKVLSNVQWGSGVDYTQGPGENKSAADVAKDLGDDNNKLNTFLGKLKLTTPVKTVKSSEDSTSTKIDSLAAGYYLVKDQDGTQTGSSDAYTKFIVQVVGDTEAAIKSGVPTVTKKVKDINDSEESSEKNPTGWQDSADYDIGDEIPYQITGTMPANIADYTTYKYIFTDTMSKGLTYTEKNAKITIGKKDVTDSFDENVTTKDGSTVVTWTCKNLKSIKDVTLNENTEVVVNYSATLNENAVIGSAGNPNTVNLTYSNNPNKGGEGNTGKTPDDKNIVFTYEAIFNKVNENNEPLSGAEFELYKKVKKTEGTGFEWVSKGNLDAVLVDGKYTYTFKGLDDGDYKLVETQTPAGYNTMEDKIFKIEATHTQDPETLKLTGLKVTGGLISTAGDDKNANVDVINGTISADIVNKKGSTLPSTGGMGTTLLYAIGGVLVALAAAYIIISKKHEKAE